MHGISMRMPQFGYQPMMPNVQLGFFNGLSQPVQYGPQFHHQGYDGMYQNRRGFVFGNPMMMINMMQCMMSMISNMGGMNCLQMPQFGHRMPPFQGGCHQRPSNFWGARPCHPAANAPAANAPAANAPAANAPAANAPAANAPAANAPAANAPAANAPAANAPAANAPAANAPAGNAPAANAPAGNAPAANAPAGNAPAANAPAGNAPAGNAPAGNAPAGNAPAANAPAGNAPAANAPAGNAPAANAPAGNAPAANAPAGNAPAGNAPAGNAPAGNAPAGNAPAGNAPAGNAPAGNAPAGNAPAGNAPAGNAPSGNAPAPNPSSGTTPTPSAEPSFGSQQPVPTTPTGPVNAPSQTEQVSPAELEAKARAGTIQAAKDMNARLGTGVKFNGNMNNQKYNPKFWQQDVIDGRKVWRVKDGVNPADALKDVFDKNGGQYSIDCAASTNLCFLRGKLEALGPEAFNEQYKNFGIRGHETWNAGPNGGPRRYDLNGGLGNHSIRGDINQDATSSDFKPGDWAYFDNKDPRTDNTPMQGENTIFLGHDQNGKAMFFGNPVGIMHLDPNDPKCKYGELTTLGGGISGNELAQEAQNFG